MIRYSFIYSILLLRLALTQNKMKQFMIEQLVKYYKEPILSESLLLSCNNSALSLRVFCIANAGMIKWSEAALDTLTSKQHEIYRRNIKYLSILNPIAVESTKSFNVDQAEAFATALES